MVIADMIMSLFFIFSYMVSRYSLLLFACFDCIAKIVFFSYVYKQKYIFLLA